MLPIQEIETTINPYGEITFAGYVGPVKVFDRHITINLDLELMNFLADLCQSIAEDWNGEPPDQVSLRPASQATGPEAQDAQPADGRGTV